MKLQGSLIAACLMILIVLSFVVVAQPADSTDQSQNSNPNQAYPAPGQPSPSEPNPIVAEYAKTHANSYEEAYRRLEIQSQIPSVIGSIAQKEPTYAGSWIQHEPEFRLFIAF